MTAAGREPIDPWAILGHVDTAIGVVAPDGTIRHVTDAIAGVTGKPSSHYAGRHVATEFHPADVDAVRTSVDRLRDAEEGAVAHSRVRMSTEDGGWVWVDQVITRAVEAPGVRGFVSSVRAVDADPRAQGELERRVGDLDRSDAGDVAPAVRDLLDLLSAQDALAASERRFRVMVQHGSDAVFTFADDGTVTSVSDSVESVLGFTPDQARSAPAFGNVVDEDRAVLDAALHRLRGEPGSTERLRLRVRDASGSTRWNETRITNLLDHPDVGEWVCNFWDVTAVVRAEEEHARLLDIFDLTDDCVLLVDPEGALMYINRAARRFFGITDDQLPRLLGRPWPLKDELNGDLAGTVLGEGRFESWSGEVLAHAAHGLAPVWLQVLAHRDHDDRIQYYSAVLRDISERKQMEATLERQATHDALTGLPNRALLFRRIEAAVQGLRAAGSVHRVGLLFIDLDHFKSINDRLGHALGDRLLRSIGERIRTAVRPGDTVARFGGDEFVVLCERLEDEQDAMVIAHRVDRTLQVPFQVDGHEIHAGVSIGIAFADADDPDPVAVLRDADTAMYRAKSEGRGRWAIFDDALRAQAVERQRLETALRGTRHGEELLVHYQPVVDLGNGGVSSVEALVRWDRGDDDGPVAPDVFVPLAEETGLIVPIGTWVLRTAAAQVARWQERPGLGHLGLAVNVSARQLMHPGFVRLVEAVLADTGLVPSSLCLELTETVLLDDVEQTRSRLDELRALGVRVAVDDFGTGYSSLTYLHRLPLDVVKLDRSFVAGVGSDPGDTAIVTAVVELARSMGLDAVAEGIETDLQLGHLRGLGCRHGQGFLLARPMAADDLGRWLASTDGGRDAVRTAGRGDPGPGPGRSDPAATGSPAGSPPG